jgi:hypothetical protein
MTKESLANPTLLAFPTIDAPFLTFKAVADEVVVGDFVCFHSELGIVRFLVWSGLTKPSTENTRRTQKKLMNRILMFLFLESMDVEVFVL